MVTVGPGLTEKSLFENVNACELDYFWPWFLSLMNCYFPATKKNSAKFQQKYRLPWNWNSFKWYLSGDPDGQAHIWYSETWCKAYGTWVSLYSNDYPTLAFDLSSERLNLLSKHYIDKNIKIIQKRKNHY